MHFMRSFHSNKVADEGFELRHLIRLYKRDTVNRPIYNRIIKGNYADVDTSKFSIQLVRQGILSDPVIYILGKRFLSTDSIRLFDKAGKRVLVYFNNTVQVIFKKELESREYVAQQRPAKTQRGPQVSLFYLMNEAPVVVLDNGLYYEPLNLFTEGYWAYEKLAELLPSDYELEE